MMRTTLWRRRGAPRLDLVLTCALLASSAGCANYSDPPPGWKGPFDAATVLDRALDAQGVAPDAPLPPARDFIASLETHRVEDDHRFDMVVLWKKPNYWRLDQVEPSGKTLRLVSDGAKLASIVDGRVVSDDLPMRSAGLHRFAYYLFPVRSFREGPGADLRIEDVKQSPEGPVIRISKVDLFGNRFVLSLDGTTLRPISLREGLPDPEGRIVILDTRFSDFAPDERGGMVPHRLDTYADGALRETLVLKQLRWNQDLRDADFRLTGG